MRTKSVRHLSGFAELVMHRALAGAFDFDAWI